MNHEQHIALREAHGHADEDAYFAARPAVADSLGRRIFRHAHERGFDAAVQALRDLSWAPPRAGWAIVNTEPRQQHGKMLPTLYVLHPDGTASVAPDDDVAKVADALRPASKTTLTVTINTGPARQALADLVAEAKAANQTMLREVGMGLIDLNVIRGAEAVVEANPWLQWDGGACPVPPQVAVEVRLRSGFTGVQGRAAGLRWTHGTWCDGDIVAYRVVREGAAS